MAEYKERDPKETIKIIEDFFNSRGCKIKENFIYETESGTYTSNYGLWLGDKQICASSGKGINEEYSRASGHAEMYERFCAFPVICYNPLNFLNYEKFNMEKHGYHLAEDEKILTIEDMLNDTSSANAFKFYLPDLEKESIENYINATFGTKELYGSAYMSLSGNKKYINSTLSSIISGTTGLAAGNTLEEALVQGASELYERYAHEQYIVKKQDKFYYVSEKCYTDKIKKIVDKINTLGLKVYLYDLSYNFNVPVFMVMIVNHHNHTFYKHFGAHPIADIAMERCFTEMYQGKHNLVIDTNGKIMMPSQMVSGKDIIEATKFSGYVVEPIVEELILHSEMVEKESDLYFKSYNFKSNSDLLKHIKIINKINNIDFYYRDISLIDEMHAVHILPNREFGGGFTFEQKDREELTKLIDNKYREIVKLWGDVGERIICGIMNNININEDIVKDINSKMNAVIVNHHDLTLFSDMFIYDITENMNCKMSCVKPDNFTLLRALVGEMSLEVSTRTDFGLLFQPWDLMYKYCLVRTYSKEEFLKILNYFGYNENDVDLYSDISNTNYVINGIYNNLRKVYNNNLYFNFIKLFVKE